MTHLAAWKRVFDVSCSIILLFVLMPILLYIIGIIKATDVGGRVFYAQARVGRKGREFRCLKFRTMHADADQLLTELLAHDAAARAEWTATHKLTRDPRITPIGRVLRASSLDELPQLLNVVIGDMSLVGPRPITPSELDGPYTTYRCHKHYVLVRPGLTGLWQVSGRSSVSYKARVALDRDYIRNISFKRDIGILLRTVAVVLRREGAY